MRTKLKHLIGQLCMFSKSCICPWYDETSIQRSGEFSMRFAFLLFFHYFPLFYKTRMFYSSVSSSSHYWTLSDGDSLFSKSQNILSNEFDFTITTTAGILCYEIRSGFRAPSNQNIPKARIGAIFKSFILDLLPI